MRFVFGSLCVVFELNSRHGCALQDDLKLK